MQGLFNPHMPSSARMGAGSQAELTRDAWINIGNRYRGTHVGAARRWQSV